MALSWCVLSWGLKVKPTDPPGSIHSPDRFHNRLKNWLNPTLWGNPDAQRSWLDKILELAIEEQLITVKDEKE
jgi:hypothetical protein